MDTTSLKALSLGIIIVCFCSPGLKAQTSPLHSVPDTKTAASSVVTFNEIMYNPLGGDPALEWVEIYNQMSVDMDISNWRIDGGIDFQFPTNTFLLSNSYLVVGADPERLRASSGATNIHGPFLNRLSSNGDTLRLRNQSGRLMDELE